MYPIWKTQFLFSWRAGLVWFFSVAVLVVIRCTRDTRRPVSSFVLIYFSWWWWIYSICRSKSSIQHQSWAAETACPKQDRLVWPIQNWGGSVDWSQYSQWYSVHMQAILTRLHSQGEKEVTFTVCKHQRFDGIQEVKRTWIILIEYIISNTVALSFLPWWNYEAYTVVLYSMLIIVCSSVRASNEKKKQHNNNNNNNSMNALITHSDWLLFTLKPHTCILLRVEPTAMQCCSLRQWGSCLGGNLEA